MGIVIKFSTLIFLTINLISQAYLQTKTPKAILAEMNLDQKIGQLLLIASHCNPSEEMQQEVATIIKKYHIGGILLLGRGYIEKEAKAIRFYKKHAHIPFLMAQDFEPGLKRLLDDPFAMDAMTLGACNNIDLTYRAGRIIGNKARMLGINLVLAPVVDVNINPHNPIINSRSFGANPDNVANNGTAFIKGIQENNVIACAKHFPGHGDTMVDSHKELPIIKHNLDRLNQVELYPFRKVIESGVKAIMSAHIMIPTLDSTNTPASLSRKIITELLKSEMNFRGVVISDALDMGGITNHMTQAEGALKAIIAGTDIIIIADENILKSPNKEDWKIYKEYIPDIFHKIKTAVINGTISESELDEHVLKILELKEFTAIKQSPKQFQLSKFCTKEQIKLKQTIFDNAVTLHNNDKKIIPIKQEAISIVQIGTDTDQPFYKKIKQNHKAKIDSYCINNTTSEKKLDETRATLANNGIIIIALHGMNKMKQQTVSIHDLSDTEEYNYGISKPIQKFINQTIEKHPDTILVIFGTPYSNTLFQKCTKLIAYEDNREAQKSAAKVIVGKIKAQGALPI